MEGGSGVGWRGGPGLDGGEVGGWGFGVRLFGGGGGGGEGFGTRTEPNRKPQRTASRSEPHEPEPFQSMYRKPKRTYANRGLTGFRVYRVY